MNSTDTVSKEQRGKEAQATAEIILELIFFPHALKQPLNLPGQKERE